MRVNEKEINELMKRHNINYEEARQLWLEDNDIVENAEIEKLTEKAKQNVKRYEKNTSKKRKPSTKERKVDTEKGEILNALKPILEEMGANNISQQTEVALHFNINDVPFTLKLTRHKVNK